MKPHNKLWGIFGFLLLIIPHTLVWGFVQSVTGTVVVCFMKEVKKNKKLALEKIKEKLIPYLPSPLPLGEGDKRNVNIKERLG
jgi:hypothetical protein